MSSKYAHDLERVSDGPAAPRWSLVTRLTLWYAGSAFVLVLGVTGYLYWGLVTRFDRSDSHFLADEIGILRVLLRDRPQDATAITQEVKWERTAEQRERIYICLLDAQGRVLIETPGGAGRFTPDMFPSPAAVGSKPGRGVEIRARTGEPFLALAARAAVGESGHGTRVIQVALNRTHDKAVLADYRRRLWLILGAAFFACVLIGHGIARRGIRPLAEITGAVRRIRSTTLHDHLECAGLPAELFVLAGTFNEMLDRLEESFDRLARFSADIAHELRTPVNNLCGEAEVALSKTRNSGEYREVLGSCLEEGRRLSRIIENLLFLARAERPDALIEKERRDVGRELTRVRDFYDAVALEGDVALTVVAPEGMLFDMNRTLFQRAIGNLVENALAHTPSGGRVMVTAQTADHTLRVEVSDTGCGIEVEHLPRLFDRFYRVDRARSTASGHTGLGLSIVKTITALHGGAVEIKSDVGRGTCVTLLFPYTPASGAHLLHAT